MASPIMGPNGQPVMSEQVAVPQVLLQYFQQFYLTNLPVVTAHYLRDELSDHSPQAICEETLLLAVEATRCLANANLKMTQGPAGVTIELLTAEQAREEQNKR